MITSTTQTTAIPQERQPGKTAPADWEAWKTALLERADRDGWPRAHVETEAYRAYFDDGYSPRDAWDEDMQHAE